MKRSNTNSSDRDEKQDESQSNVLRKKLASAEEFEAVFKFIYVNKDYFAKYFVIDWMKNKSAPDLLASAIIKGCTIRSDPDRAFNDFQKVIGVKDEINPTTLSKFLNQNAKTGGLQTNIYQLLLNRKDRDTMLKTIDNWYEQNATPEQKTNRDIRIEKSGKFQLMEVDSGRDVLNYLDVNVDFFLAPFVDPSFQTWASPLSGNTTIDQFSESMHLVLGERSNIPSKKMYGHVPYVAALESLKKGKKGEMQNFLKTNPAIVTIMLKAMKDNSMHFCISKWYQEPGHEENLKERVERVKAISNLNQTPVQKRENPSTHFQPHAKKPKTEESTTVPNPSYPKKKT